MHVDAKTALDTKIRPKLEESFGTGMTDAILSAYAQQLGVSLNLPTRDQYVQLAEAVASDTRVREMWGFSKAKFQALAWKGALRN
ncbi:MAG: hypothetical protein AUJ92_18705 [Armatimonadetes bacterium CG2_30_59_28]|nr:MAG: hypothetical protein AUJ92_18705 [Armatimonadetes bacterium CG2_30_59_28]